VNTSSKDRALLPAVRKVLESTDNPRTPISRLQTAKAADKGLKVTLHTSRPQHVRMHTDEIVSALKDKVGGDRDVTVVVVPEARAVAKFVRTSPRKARLVGDALKGKRVSDAIALLKYIPNHAAALIEKVVVSAAANAMDGWSASPEELKIANIIADGGPTMKRVRPRAQGRAYRILKRMSHLTVILVDAPPAPKRRPAAKPVPAKPTKAPAKVTAKARAEKPKAEEPKVADTTPEVEATVETPVAQAVEATPVAAADQPEIDTSDARAETTPDEPGEEK